MTTMCPAAWRRLRNAPGFGPIPGRGAGAGSALRDFARNSLLLLTTWWRRRESKPAPSPPKRFNSSRFLGLQMGLAQRVGRKEKDLLDRLITRFLGRLTAPRTPKRGFMRDEPIEEDIGLGVEELDAYQAGRH
jgi:hypothetical protein